MIVSVFDPITGKITQSVSVANGETATKLYGNWIAGSWPNDQYHIVNGQAQLLPAKPATDLPVRFNYQTKTWETIPIMAERLQRRRRNSKLKPIDQVNAIRYASLSVDQQQELAQYRQALLDVPQQPGFPQQIEWPAKPGWL